MKTRAQKTAVVLFNLGGPDRLGAVFPFLYNLFSDSAILRLPFGLRHFVALMIALKRTREAKHIYKLIGGRSPILPNTYRQAYALEEALGEGYRTFVTMRYWHPRMADVIGEIESYGPDRIVLLPLYPQFSTTTTASALSEYFQYQTPSLKNTPTTHVCCYPVDALFAEGVARQLAPVLERLDRPVRVLFSAHGLPQSIVDKGDPYPDHVRQTVAKVVSLLPPLLSKGLDYRVTFQSRVGPVAWVKPYTDEEIQQAGRESVSVVLVPISFVSEHSETLVECDLQYRDLAEQSGVPAYVRVPTLSTDPLFIQSLAGLVREAVGAAPCSARSFCKGVYCAQSADSQETADQRQVG